ncbi:ABC transporter ATP-binding protein [Paenibacillus caui]|uniref:ABC transporter ATP-binding protein n=1 Tax=Paenibacillus caui TaxID=2873927 RepID=UPI001CA7C84A|nr:ABC transporter ATP-binding protein [Paenibacillus caui]
MSGHILELHQVRKHFRNFTLSDINFTLPKGYIMGLVGPNGAGKSTTIKSIMNTVDIDSGSIRVLGKDTKKNEAAVKSTIGYVSDTCIFGDTWTVKNVAFLMKHIHPSWNSTTFNDYVKEFELPWNKPLKDFSRGMKLKLMLAAALSRDTSFLLLDEPTGGLDPVMRDRFLQLMQQYVEGGEHSILFSTHITTDLEKIADYITFIHGGNMIFTGETEELRSSFCLIKGSDRELKELKAEPVGIRRSSFGFEALMRTEHIRSLPHTVVVEAPTLDDIVVFHTLGNKESSLL